MRIGVTGHQRISDPTAWPWVKTEILNLLRSEEHLTGISSLAIGADQLFAECILELGGTLIAVIPFPDYERTFNDESERQNYQLLIKRAADVRTLPSSSDDQESYLAAGKLVIELCELLIAVWDGRAAKGKGGTGDAVQFAQSIGRDVLQINPDNRVVLKIQKEG